MLFSRKYVKLGIEVKSGILKVNVVSEEGALDFNITSTDGTDDEAFKDIVDKCEKYELSVEVEVESGES